MLELMRTIQSSALFLVGTFSPEVEAKTVADAFFLPDAKNVLEEPRPRAKHSPHFHPLKTTAHELMKASTVHELMKASSRASFALEEGAQKGPQRLRFQFSLCGS